MCPPPPLYLLVLLYILSFFAEKPVSQHLSLNPFCFVTLHAPYLHCHHQPQNILLAHQDRNKQGSTPTTTPKNETKLEDREPADIRREGTQDSIYDAFEQGGYIPKISDMGVGKMLMGQSSFGLSTLGSASTGLAATGAGGQSKDVAGAGPGSVGWQAPEVMAQRRLPRATSASMTKTCSDNGGGSPSDHPTGGLVDTSSMEVDLPTAAARTSRSVDIFSLGCIFYCTIIPGSHPFGEWYEREANIMKNEPNTKSLDAISVEASDLVCSMIARDPTQRPTAAQVCLHPFFWDATRRLAFLCQLSDRLEATSPTLTDSADSSAQQQTYVDPFLVERNAAAVVGTSWDKNLDQGLLINVSRFRTYDPSSVRDLLRLIRNKHHHFDELPEDVKRRLGPSPVDLITYFERAFPGLVMHCFRVCRDNLTKDDPLNIKFCIPARLSTFAPAASKRTHADDSRQTEKFSIGTEAVASPDSFPNKSPESKNMDATKYSSHSEVLSSTRLSVAAAENNSHEISAEVDSYGEGKDGSSAITDVTTEVNLLSTEPSPLTLEEEKMGDDAEVIPYAKSLSPKVIENKVEEDDSEQIFRALSSSSGGFMAVKLASASTPALQDERASADEASKTDNVAEGLVIWEGSTAAKTFNCRGWYRSEDDWVRRVDCTLRKRDANVSRCATDSKFRTRLCNHWDSSQGTNCPMKRKKKCIFAHGPVELRVKEGKRNRWGKLVDAEGNCSNPKASGGEDTYGAARSIETMREKEGKWTPNKQGKQGTPNNANRNNTGRYRGKQSGGGPKKGDAK